MPGTIGRVGSRALRKTYLTMSGCAVTSSGMLYCPFAQQNLYNDFPPSRRHNATWYYAKARVHTSRRGGMAMKHSTSAIRTLSWICLRTLHAATMAWTHPSPERRQSRPRRARVLRHLFGLCVAEDHVFCFKSLHCHGEKVRFGKIVCLCYPDILAGGLFYPA